MNVASRCVTGLIRKNNEDAIYCGDGDGLEGLYIVADGMGGHNAGEVASSRAIEVFSQYVKANKDRFLDDGEVLDVLIEAMQRANLDVYQMAQGKKACSGMGTTLDAAVLRGKRLFITHVGDGRVYTMKRGVLRRLTEDHSYVEELVRSGRITEEQAMVHPNRNIITRAIGTKGDIETDTIIENIDKGDIVLLCTDGLTNMVSEKELYRVLKSEKELEENAHKLVDMANSNGGIDNISLIIIEHEVVL